MLACEQAAPRVFAARSRVLVRLASLAQRGELARRLHKYRNLQNNTLTWATARKCSILIRLSSLYYSHVSINFVG